MAKFTDPKARVEIDLGAGNRVWVKAKMSLRDQTTVEQELMSIQISSGEMAKAQKGETPSVNFVFSMTAQKLILLKHNIVRWAGPDFEENGRPIPCTPEFVERLDPVECEEWIEMIAERIGDLNTKKVSGEVTDPN